MPSTRVYAIGYRSNLPAFRVRANGQLATGSGDGGPATNTATNVSAWDVMLRGDLLPVAGGQAGVAIHATRYLL